MTEQPPGWYPDPFAAVPGSSRYWDGERWTTQVQSPLPEPQPSGHPDGAVPSGGGWGAPSGHPERPWMAAGEDHRGEASSWMRRASAYLIDIVPVVIVTMLVLAMTGVTDAMNRAIETGSTADLDAVSAMLSPLSPTGFAVTAVNLLFLAAYNIGFHVSRGQTLGKMAVGIRVRMADEDRNPDLRAATLRWLVQFGPSLLNGLATIGFLAGVFNLVDHLWPLWDQRSQAIHDKAGRTVVVRTR